MTILFPEFNMTDNSERPAAFPGTYYDRDEVLRLVHWANILAWVILSIYLISGALSLAQFLIQLLTGLYFQKGMGILDLLNFFPPYLQMPLPGVFIFFGLQGIGKLLMILMDIEDNTRRAARKN